MLTGEYSIREIKKIGDNLGLMSERKNPHALNTYYKIFTNKFYYGYFFWKNDKGILVKHKGKHKKMISEIEFEYVQIILGNRKRITRPKKYNHAYTGLMKCGECQSSITAENKHQVRCTNCRYKFSCLHRDDCPKCKTKITSMKNPATIKLVYYRCTKRKKKCSQKFITQKKLENQIIATLKSIEIPKNFYDFMYDELKKLHKQMDSSNSDIINSLKKRLSELNNRKNSLALMRADNEISSEEFIKYKKETSEKISILEKEMKIDEYKETNWLVIAKDYLNIAINASSIIHGKDNFTKKRLLSKLGSNQTLIDKKLYILKAKPLLAIKNCYNLYYDEMERFEPEKSLVKQGLSEGLYTLNSSWCAE